MTVEDGYERWGYVKRRLRTVEDGGGMVKDVGGRWGMVKDGGGRIWMVP